MKEEPIKTICEDKENEITRSYHTATGRKIGDVMRVVCKYCGVEL